MSALYVDEERHDTVAYLSGGMRINETDCLAHTKPDTQHSATRSRAVQQMTRRLSTAATVQTRHCRSSLSSMAIAAPRDLRDELGPGRRNAPAQFHAVDLLADAELPRVAEVVAKAEQEVHEREVETVLWPVLELAPRLRHGG